MIRVVLSGSRSQFLIFYPSRILGSKRHRIPDPDPLHWKKLQIHLIGRVEVDFRDPLVALLLRTDVKGDGQLHGEVVQLHGSQPPPAQGVPDHQKKGMKDNQMCFVFGFAENRSRSGSKTGSRSRVLMTKNGKKISLSQIFEFPVTRNIPTVLSTFMVKLAIFT
jgi:hypothetical protein